MFTARYELNLRFSFRAYSVKELTVLHSVTNISNSNHFHISKSKTLKFFLSVIDKRPKNVAHQLPLIL